MNEGIEKLARHQSELCGMFIEGIREVDGLRYFGPQGVKNRVGVFSVKIEGLDPHELAGVLESSYGILTRAGIHCAPAAHAAIGTSSGGGTTRFSFGPFVSENDVRFAANALAEIAGTMGRELEGGSRRGVQSSGGVQQITS
jgi:selenocysteine lyase/cysteine desulfurase